MPRGVKKTCIPGLFCIENMTMFLLFVLLITVVYFINKLVQKKSLKYWLNGLIIFVKFVLSL